MYIMFINRVFPTGGMGRSPTTSQKFAFFLSLPPLPPPPLPLPPPPPPPFDFYFLPIKSRFPPH